MKSAAPLLTALAYSIFLIAGLSAVPFHPDETSLLYQSRDFDQYLKNPRALAWSPTREQDQEQVYRALNAPLPKYVFGLFRRIGGFDAAQVSVDWDWTEDFQQNVVRGALPADDLLWIARLGSTLLLPAGLYFLYRTGKSLDGPRTGWLAVGFLGLNSIFLLHGRRAMAEGVLFFGICLALWSLTAADQRPALAGIAAAVALAAKHSALALFPVGLLAVVWSPGPSGGWRSRAASAARFLIAAGILTLLLNPFLWSDPLRAGQRIWEARASLVQDQVQTQAIAEHVAVELPMSTTDRLSAMLSQVYFAPAQYQEVGNYQQALASSFDAYGEIPGHSLFRGWLPGSLILGLSLTGVMLATMQARRADGAARRKLTLLLAASAAVAAALWWGIPFPFQRYYVPMLPLSALWAAYATGKLLELSKKLLSGRAALN